MNDAQRNTHAEHFFGPQRYFCVSSRVHGRPKWEAASVITGGLGCVVIATLESADMRNRAEIYETAELVQVQSPCIRLDKHYKKTMKQMIKIWDKFDAATDGLAGNIVIIMGIVILLGLLNKVLGWL